MSRSCPISCGDQGERATLSLMPARPPLSLFVCLSVAPSINPLSSSMHECRRITTARPTNVHYLCPYHSLFFISPSLPLSITHHPQGKTAGCRGNDGGWEGHPTQALTPPVCCNELSHWWALPYFFLRKHATLCLCICPASSVHWSMQPLAATMIYCFWGWQASRVLNWSQEFLCVDAVAWSQTCVSERDDPLSLSSPSTDPGHHRWS